MNESGYLCVAVVAWLSMPLLGMTEGAIHGRAGRGFLLGALLGPFGVLLAALSQPTEAVAYRRTVAELARQERAQAEVRDRPVSAAPFAGLASTGGTAAAAPNADGAGLVFRIGAYLTIGAFVIFLAWVATQ